MRQITKTLIPAIALIAIALTPVQSAKVELLTDYSSDPEKKVAKKVAKKKAAKKK